MRSGEPFSPLTTRWSSQTFSASVLGIDRGYHPTTRSALAPRITADVTLVRLHPGKPGGREARRKRRDAQLRTLHDSDRVLCARARGEDERLGARRILALHD